MTVSKHAQQIINNHALAAAGVGIPGIVFPAADMAGMTIIWGKMLVELAEESGHEVDLKFAGKVITSMTAGVSLYIGGSKLMTWLLNLIPGVGTIASAAINAMFNWVYTLRLGKLLAEQFSRPGFTPSMLVLSASGIASMVFAIPTFSEINDAFHAIGHLLHIGSQASDVAHHASAGADLVSHGATFADHTTNIGHAVSHGANIAHHASSVRFGGLHQALMQVTGTTIPAHAVNQYTVPQFLQALLPHAQQHAPQYVPEMQRVLASGTEGQMQEVTLKVIKAFPRWLAKGLVHVHFGGGSSN
jgi:uncharacterized protein (DUF697 family)